MARVGDKLGRYDLTGELGQGGMSVVYRARDESLRREVAIKVMHAFLAEQTEAKERFHREAVAVARLKHPHIIEVFDYSGETQSESYIVEELVEGQPLAKWLGDKPIDPPEAALLVALPIAEALAHAHDQGVIHRDLKPENVLVSTSGALKLTDFGIARMLDSQTMTITGTLLGSPAYMAPEYIDGKETDARADVFSFGAMLYQLVIGRLPFVATSPHALLRRIVAGEFEPVEQANPEVPAPLARLIHRCLATDPAARYATAAELVRALRELADLLDLTAAERPRLLGNRAAYGEDLKPLLVDRWMKIGKVYLAEGHGGRAVECFDRVLRLHPEHAEVKKLLRRIHRRDRAARVMRDAGIALVGAALLTATWVTLAPVVSDWFTPTPAIAATPLPEADPADERRDVAFFLTGRGDLSIDGNVVRPDASGALALRLAPGPHRATFANDADETSFAFEVPSDREVAVSPVSLRLRGRAEVDAPSGASSPANPANVPMRSVEFNAANPVDLYVDGATTPVVTGRTNVFAVPLSHGPHRLRFVNPNAEPLDLELNVSERDPPERISVRMQFLPAKLKVSGIPDGYLVEVNERRSVINPLTRQDPINVPLPLGEGTRRFTVRVLDGAEKPVFARELSFVSGRVQELAVEPGQL